MSSSSREVSVHITSDSAHGEAEENPAAAGQEAELLSANGMAGNQRTSKDDALSASVSSFGFNALEAISETEEPASGNATPVLQRNNSAQSRGTPSNPPGSYGAHLVEDISSLGSKSQRPPSIEVSFEDSVDPIEVERLAEERSRLKPLKMSEYSASVRSLHDKDVDDLMLRAVHLLEDGSPGGSEASLQEADKMLTAALGGSGENTQPDSSKEEDEEGAVKGVVDGEQGSPPSTSPKKSGNFITATLTKNDKGVGLGVIDGHVSTNLWTDSSDEEKVQTLFTSSGVK